MIFLCLYLNRGCCSTFQVDFLYSRSLTASRLRCIHLKDGSPEGKGCSLGQGAAPVKAVRKKAIELGVGIVVESEGLDPTGKEEVERCINFLKACDAEDAE